MRRGISLLGCLPSPPRRLYEVLRNPFAITIIATKVVLRRGMSFFCCLPSPPRRLYEVLRNSLAVIILDTKVQ